MRHIRRTVVFLAAVLGMLSASHAQVPEAPLNCPTSAAVNDVVCATETLGRQAHEVERYYFAAAAVSFEETLRLRSTWHAEYMECGFLVRQMEQMRACISDSFHRFVDKLSTLAVPGEKTREQLFQEASTRLSRARDLAHQNRDECIRKEALGVDDGVSSARDVAVVVAKRCRTESANIGRLLAEDVELSIPFMTLKRTSPEARREVVASLSEPDGLIEVILELRAAKRKKSAPAPKKAPPSKML